ncbi:sugar ABC transporter permease [Clostridiales bacterium COT073_COT-073]|nr:sugar ABC transporter permease [Clostridiales bacterium COT073_COT-073]
MFDQNLALTAGAPAGQTTMLALDIYNTYYNRIGFAGIGQAKSVLFTMIVFLLVMIQLQIWEKEKGRNYAVF